MNVKRYGVWLPIHKRFARVADVGDSLAEAETHLALVAFAEHAKGAYVAELPDLVDPPRACADDCPRPGCAAARKAARR